jgi:hypothetical protein
MANILSASVCSDANPSAGVEVEVEGAAIRYVDAPENPAKGWILILECLFRLF